MISSPRYDARENSSVSALETCRRRAYDWNGECIDNNPDQSVINGERVENLEIFLDRLQTAKRRVDQRITMLGGADNSASTPLGNLFLRD